MVFLPATLTKGPGIRPLAAVPGPSSAIPSHIDGCGYQVLFSAQRPEHSASNGPRDQEQSKTVEDVQALRRSSRKTMPSARIVASAASEVAAKQRVKPISKQKVQKPEEQKANGKAWKRVCVVPSCRSNESKCPQKKFFTLTKGAVQRTLIFRLIRSKHPRFEDKSLISGLFICESHYRETDIIYPGPEAADQQPKLKKGALPLKLCKRKKNKTVTWEEHPINISTLTRQPTMITAVESSPPALTGQTPTQSSSTAGAPVQLNNPEGQKAQEQKTLETTEDEEEFRFIYSLEDLYKSN